MKQLTLSFTSSELQTLTDDQFLERFKPQLVDANQAGDYVLQSCPVSAHPSHVWTVVEGDSGSLYLIPGFRKVNVEGWIVTEVPHDFADIEVLWWDANDFPEEDESEVEEVQGQRNTSDLVEVISDILCGSYPDKLTYEEATDALREEGLDTWEAYNILTTWSGMCPKLRLAMGWKENKENLKNFILSHLLK